MTDLKALSKHVRFAAIYGAGPAKIDADHRRLKAQVFGTFFDGTAIVPLTGDEKKLSDLRLLLEDIEFNMPFLQSGMEALAKPLEGLSDLDRRKRMDALNTIAHQLDEAMAEWGRKLDELGISIVE